jgi:hypothetical protein
MNDNPFTYSSLSNPASGLIAQEIVTYMKRDNQIIKITVKRNFTEDDYTDNMTTEVLYSW